MSTLRSVSSTSRHDGAVEDSDKNMTDGQVGVGGNFRHSGALSEKGWGGEQDDAEATCRFKSVVWSPMAASIVRFINY